MPEIFLLSNFGFSRKYQSLRLKPKLRISDILNKINNMKNGLLLLLSFILILAENGCCTKKYCFGYEDINEIQLQGFEANELDSVILETFVKETNFQNRIDSVFIAAYDNQDSSFVLYMPNKLDINADYKISMLSTAQIVRLTAFEVENKTCNCPTDKYKVLKSYQVNGIKQTESRLIITK